MNRLMNCTVASNFAAAEALDILRDTVAPLYLPSEIYDEIVAGQLAGYVFYDGIERHIAPFATDGWMRLVSMTDSELAMSADLSSSLHRGETACLCIARQRGWAFLSDDRAARNLAKRWGIPVTGTLGILLIAMRSERLTLDMANALLWRMIDRANYHSPVSDLRSLLRR